jgi:fucose 4-O-acetylase-like acetyltransferase
MARRVWFDVVTLLLAALFVLGAPMAQSWSTGLLFLDGYLNHNTGSLFPLFPWFAFCAVGSLASRWEMTWKNLLPASAAFIALGEVFALASYSYVHPAFFAERLGWLGLLITAVWLFSQKFSPAWLQLAGRESLLIYVAHLLLLHSIPWEGVTLNLYIGRTLSIPMTAAAIAIVLGVCLGFAWLNERRKARDRVAVP